MVKTITVYLSGPIAGCDDSAANDWREYAKSKGEWYDLNKPVRFKFLNPMTRDFRETKIHDKLVKLIVEHDMVDINESNAVIVRYDPNFACIGTIMETVRAFLLNKLVVVIYPKGVSVSPWFRYHSQAVIVEDGTAAIDQALEYIYDALVLGKINI